MLAKKFVNYLASPSALLKNNILIFLVDLAISFAWLISKESHYPLSVNLLPLMDFVSSESEIQLALLYLSSTMGKSTKFNDVFH